MSHVWENVFDKVLFRYKNSVEFLVISGMRNYDTSKILRNIDRYLNMKSLKSGESCLDDWQFLFTVEEYMNSNFSPSDVISLYETIYKSRFSCSIDGFFVGNKLLSMYEKYDQSKIRPFALEYVKSMARNDLIKKDTSLLRYLGYILYDYFENDSINSLFEVIKERDLNYYRWLGIRYCSKVRLDRLSYRRIVETEKNLGLIELYRNGSLKETSSKKFYFVKETDSNGNLMSFLSSNSFYLISKIMDSIVYEVE